MSHSGYFFWDFGRLGAKKMDFRSPLGSSWVQNGAQNHPSGAKMLTESRTENRLAFQARFRDAPGHHFD